jgi:uncharacterized protein (DUF488 family)
MKLWTIGHSNHSIETFISLLHQHGVTAVVDVRSHPYSRRLPHFNKAPLQASLNEASIHYVFLGRELGARPEDLSCYLDGKALYERIASTELFSEGIQRLLKGAETYRIALMCAEKDPLTCHRTILICRQLRQFEISITHILGSGEVESHVELEKRLLNLHHLAPSNSQQEQLHLFDLLLPSEPSLTPTEALEIAYQRQSDRIAYVEKPELESNPKT